MQRAKLYPAYYTHAVIFYNETFATPTGKEYKVAMYLLDEVYIILAKGGSNLHAFEGTDITVMRAALDEIISGIQGGMYE